VVQHYWWVTDPAATQNPRRAAYEVFDPEFSVLREFLSRQGRGQNARDLEFGVAWLMWMLGFSVASLGSTGKTQDFSDVIATTPNGHFAVVECTTGQLRADNKLPLVVERATALRRNVERSNNRHLRVLPVMVTSKLRDEVRADLAHAQQLGVVVLTREDMEAALEQRTRFMPDADAIFAEAERSLSSSDATAGANPSSPLT
jgi:hypothetical protein